VPDFCGMTMEMANILLKQLRDIKTTQVQRKPASISAIPEPSPPTVSHGPPQIPPLPVQYPSSPAPAAQPPPGTYNVPVPADPGYAAPSRQDQMSQSPYPPQHPPMPVKPAMQPGRPSYEQAPAHRQEMPATRPPPPVQVCNEPQRFLSSPLTSPLPT
jgi:hypothetical protein